MSEATDIADRGDAMLAELAELALTATRRVHERLMAAEDDAAFHEAGRTFQRLARSLRQTLALKSSWRATVWPTRGRPARSPSRSTRGRWTR
jgi:hypothetical protein